MDELTPMPLVIVQQYPGTNTLDTMLDVPDFDTAAKALAAAIMEVAAHFDVDIYEVTNQIDDWIDKL